MGLVSFLGRALHTAFREGMPDNRKDMLLGQSAVHAMLSRRGDFKHLWDAEIKVFSQWGEDGILAYLCAELELVKPNVIEFGVGDFTECNTRFLATSLNANVVAVDILDSLRTNHLNQDLKWKTHFTPLVHWITPDQARLDLDFAKRLLGGVDIISLDIDGNDYWIMNSLELDGVSIIIVEYNAIFGPTAAVTIPRDDSFFRTKAHYSNLYYGASLSAWIYLFTEKGFRFVGTNLAGNNAFFVSNENLHKLELALPDLGDLSIYTRWYVREARDQQGNLTLTTAFEDRSSIDHLEIIDVSTQEILRICDLET
jgi:hypothetical protein